RRVGGAPTALEEKQLREGCARLQGLKRQEQVEALRLHGQNVSRLNDELIRLLKQAVVEGFHPVRLQSAQISLREGETLHWEGTGMKLKQRISRGNAYWKTEVRGTLLVTSERILLDARPQRLWPRALSKLLRVERQHLSVDRGLDLLDDPVSKLLRGDRQHLPEGPIIIMWLDGLQKPVGLWVADLELSVSVGSQTRTIKLDSGDLAR